MKAVLHIILKTPGWTTQVPHLMLTSFQSPPLHFTNFVLRRKRKKIEFRQAGLQENIVSTAKEGFVPLVNNAEIDLPLFLI